MMWRWTRVYTQQQSSSRANIESSIFLDFLLCCCCCWRFFPCRRGVHKSLNRLPMLRPLFALLCIFPFIADVTRRRCQCVEKEKKGFGCVCGGGGAHTALTATSASILNGFISSSPPSPLGLRINTRAQHRAGKQAANWGERGTTLMTTSPHPTVCVCELHHRRFFATFF